MNEKKLNKFLEDMSFSSSLRILETASDSVKLKEICNKKGIVYPSRDLAVFECIYAYTDRVNKNGCLLPKEEVEKSLPTLVGKAVDFDHLRKRVVGTWIDAKLDNDKIIAHGIFFKGNFPEDFDEISELMKDGILAVSFEAWGDREPREDGSYDLTSIEWAGGALLIRTDPAFDGAGVIEMAKKKKDRVLEMAKVMKAPSSFVREKTKEEAKLRPYNMDYLWDCISQIENLDGKTTGYFDIMMIDFDNSQVKLRDLTTNGELMIDLSPKITVTDKGDNPNVAKIHDLSKVAKIEDVGKFINEFKGNDRSLEIQLESSFDGPRISHTQRTELDDEDFAVVKTVKVNEVSRKLRLLPIVDLDFVAHAKSKLEESYTDTVLEKLGVDKSKVIAKINRREIKNKMEKLYDKIKKSSLEEVLQEMATASLKRSLTEAELEKAYSLVGLKPGGSGGSDTSLLSIPVKKSAGNETSLVNAEDLTEEKLKAVITNATELPVTATSSTTTTITISADASDKDQKISELQALLTKANELISKFEKSQQAVEIASRREILGDFGKDISDADILNDVKFEMAKKDKRIAELEAASTTTARTTAAKPKTMVKGSADKDTPAAEVTSRELVDKYAWGSEGSKDDK